MITNASHRTARSAKVAAVQRNNAIYGNDVEVVSADDLAFGDFTDALEGRYQSTFTSDDRHQSLRFGCQASAALFTPQLHWLEGTHPRTLSP